MKCEIPWFPGSPWRTVGAWISGLLGIGFAIYPLWCAMWFGALSGFARIGGDRTSSTSDSTFRVVFGTTFLLASALLVWGLWVIWRSVRWEGLRPRAAIIGACGACLCGILPSMPPFPTFSTNIVAVLWLALMFTVTRWGKAYPARNRHRCHHCGYPRIGLPSGAPCPECGTCPHF
jgi:hypothetical protein